VGIDVMFHASLTSEVEKTMASFTMGVVCPQGSVPGYETSRFLEVFM